MDILNRQQDMDGYEKALQMIDRIRGFAYVVAEKLMKRMYNYERSII